MEITQTLPKELKADSTIRWDEFCIASDAAGIELPDEPSLQKEIKWVFGLSDFVSKTASPYRLLSRLVFPTPDDPSRQ